MFRIAIRIRHFFATETQQWHAPPPLRINVCDVWHSSDCSRSFCFGSRCLGQYCVKTPRALYRPFRCQCPNCVYVPSAAKYGLYARPIILACLILSVHNVVLQKICFGAFISWCQSGPKTFGQRACISAEYSCSLPEVGIGQKIMLPMRGRRERGRVYSLTIPSRRAASAHSHTA